MDLVKKRCRPCEGDIDKLDAAQAGLLLPQVPGWKVDGDALIRRFELEDFKAAMSFLNKVADIAEGEGHHPDFSVHYNRVDFKLQTHAIRGLSENDFILAAKISDASKG
jgi:4a-hydroxytetrahydrobiopterin dehydratase